MAQCNARRRSFAPLAVAFAAVVVSSRTAAAAEPVPASSSAAARPLLAPPVLHALGIMTVMRASEAYLWPHPFAETNQHTLAHHYHEAFSRPPLFDSSRPLFQADGDRWHINVLGHGLFGSELYLRARSCRFVWWQALLFAGVASATWEYGFEANGVRPSALDLTFTPLSGLVLGEGRYQAYWAAQRVRSTPLRVTLQAILDPLGELERRAGAPC